MLDLLNQMRSNEHIQQCFMTIETNHINFLVFLHFFLFPLYHLLSLSRHTEDKTPKTCSTFYSIEYTKSCQFTFYYSSESEMKTRRDLFKLFECRKFSSLSTRILECSHAVIGETRIRWWWWKRWCSYIEKSLVVIIQQLEHVLS